MYYFVKYIVTVSLYLPNLWIIHENYASKRFFHVWTSWPHLQALKQLVLHRPGHTSPYKEKKNYGIALSHWKLNFINSTDSQCRFRGVYSQNSDWSDSEVAQVFLQTSQLFLTPQVVLMVKNLLPMLETQRSRFISWVRKILRRRKMATHASILTWKFPQTRGAWWSTVHGVTKS